MDFCYHKNLSKSHFVGCCQWRLLGLQFKKISTFYVGSMARNKECKEFLLKGPNEVKEHLSNKMYYIWDANHCLKTWMEYIKDNHPNNLEWHFVVRTMVLDARKQLLAYCRTFLLR